MNRGLWDRVAFAAKLRSVDEAPEPLRSAMFEVLEPQDAIRWLIYGPTQKVVGRVSPASLLAILEHEWIVVVCGENAEPEVHRCQFADSLLVEIIDILLYGRLRLDFIKDSRTRSVAVEFNTVMAELYQEAVQILLGGMDGVCQAALDDSGKTYDIIKVLPLKFQNGILRYLPVGQRVLGFVHWPTVLSRKLTVFWRELAPEGVLVLTNSQLLIISEEKAWWRGQSKYGYVVTFCPLSRVEAIRLTEHNSFYVIDVEVRARQIGEKVKIGFPCELKAALEAFTELVTSSPGFLQSRPEVRGYGAIDESDVDSPFKRPR